MSDLWERVEDKDGPPNSEWSATFHSPEKDWSAWVKRDGCIELRHYFNGRAADDGIGGGEDVDGLHLCSIDEMIARLQALKEQAVAHFREHRREFEG